MDGQCHENAETALKESCPCREAEISYILKLIGNKDEPSVPSIFLYGHTATGKSHVLTQIMAILRLPCVHCNCVELSSPKLLYKEILKAAGGYSENVSKSCSSMSDFVRYFKQTRSSENGETFFVILDKAERLRDMDANVLPCFLRLAEITNANVCTILVSELPYEKFYTSGGLFAPFRVHFQNYSKLQLLKIMSRKRPPNSSPNLYVHYLKVVLDVFFGVCRDLNELQYLATANFRRYREPVASGEVSEDDVRKLWIHINPLLKEALHGVYLRDISSANQPRESGKARPAMDLPYYSKYLLIAAFLASYNPANTDRRIFVKKSLGKMGKRTKTAIKAAKNMDKKYLGPRAFPLDRMMAIFYSIVEGGANPSAMIQSQISTLVTLNFLVKCSADDQIDAAKYKCIVPFSFVSTIGKQVEFDVGQYLYDS